MITVGSTVLVNYDIFRQIIAVVIEVDPDDPRLPYKVKLRHKENEITLWCGQEDLREINNCIFCNNIVGD